MTMLFMFMGLCLTLLGVGGVEHSLTGTELLQSLAVSLVGLSFMWVATAMIRKEL
jgi:hypothetical protein